MFRSDLNSQKNAAATIPIQPFDYHTFFEIQFSADNRTALFLCIFVFHCALNGSFGTCFHAGIAVDIGFDGRVADYL